MPDPTARRGADAEPSAMLPVDVTKLAEDEAVVRRGFWHKVRTTLGRIPFTEDVISAYYCAVDGETPLYAKAILMGAVAYFVTPADVIPDFIVGLGFTDDAAVLLAAMKAIGDNLKPAHRERARAFLAKPDREDRAAGGSAR